MGVASILAAGAPVMMEADIFDRENNRSIVLLFKDCSELEVMLPTFEGLDDGYFLDRMRGLYGHLFREFQRSEQSIEARKDLGVDAA